MAVLRYELSDGVADVVLDNPPVNALGAEFLDEFEAVLDRLEPPGAARALVIRSACEGFFSAGDDVKSLQELGPDSIDMAILRRAHGALVRLEALPIPSVAAINGHALGGGLELALACDFRLMGRDSGTVGLPEVRLGMIPALGGTQRLPLLVGRGKALELMIKGLQIDAEEAMRIGLVTAIHPTDELEERALEYASHLACQATAAVACIKRAVNTGLYEGFDRGIASEMAAFEENIRHPDVTEGIDAFLAGRKPEFSGATVRP